MSAFERQRAFDQAMREWGDRFIGRTNHLAKEAALKFEDDADREKVREKRKRGERHKTRRER